jgi:hypothetical protein
MNPGENSPYTSPTTSSSNYGTTSPTSTEARADDLKEQAERKARDWKERASHLGHEAKEKASQLGHEAEEKFDRARQSVADTMQRTADGLRERAAGDTRYASYAQGAANRVESAARYVRDHRAGDYVGDLEGVIRRHPGRSFLAALAVGFLLGRSMSSRH